MNTQHFFSALAFLLFSTVIFAQSSGNINYNNPSNFKQHGELNIQVPTHTQVDLQAEVMTNIKASSYVAIFSVTQYGTSVAETDSLLTMRLQIAKNGLKSIGIPQANIHVDVITAVPTYAMILEEKMFSATANEVPTGFQVKKNIHIIFENHNLLEGIVSWFAKAEIYDLVKVDYNVQDIQAAYDQLRNEAAKIVNAKGLQYHTMGLHLEVVNMNDDFQAAYPLERYDSYTAYFTGSSVEEVKQIRRQASYQPPASNVYVQGYTPSVHLHLDKLNIPEPDKQFIVKTTQKNKTIFYNRIPYNQFDNVLNADVVEPCIQFYYTLKVRYTVSNLAQWEALQRQKAEEEALKKMSKRERRKLKRG